MERTKRVLPPAPAKRLAVTGAALAIVVVGLLVWNERGDAGPQVVMPHDAPSSTTTTDMAEPALESTTTSTSTSPTTTTTTSMPSPSTTTRKADLPVPTTVTSPPPSTTIPTTTTTVPTHPWVKNGGSVDIWEYHTGSGDNAGLAFEASGYVATSSVDWGDGTPVHVEQATEGPEMTCNLYWEVSPGVLYHRYPAAGTYTAVVTSNGSGDCATPRAQYRDTVYTIEVTIASVD